MSVTSDTEDSEVQGNQIDPNEHVDEMPDDLAATERDLEDYIFPNNN